MDCENAVVTTPSTVEQYCGQFSADAADALSELCRVSRSAAPAATEAIKWGHPTFLHPQGTILFVFSGHKKHANFVFTPSTREAFAEELVGFTTGKGRVQLPYGEPVPAELLQRMIRFRIEEFEQHGVKWM